MKSPSRPICWRSTRRWRLRKKQDAAGAGVDLLLPRQGAEIPVPDLADNRAVEVAGVRGQHPGDVPLDLADLDGVLDLAGGFLETQLEELFLEIGQRLGIDLRTGVDIMVESGYGPRGTLWESLNGSAGLTPVKGPPSLENRYVTEDIPYGLVAWASIGDAVGVETPMMDALIDLGSVIIGKDCRKEGRNLDRMGLGGMDLEQIKAFLNEG